MKQYTSKDQTAKLIELGFPKPKTYHNLLWDENDKLDLIGWQINYSIGELIEFLCPHFHTTIYRLELQKISECAWEVEARDVNDNSLNYQVKQELVDVLFCACVTLKEEGVI